MKKIYAPWRDDYTKYITNASKTHDRLKTTKKECVFCKQFLANDDDKYFILKRFKHSAIIMNLYPYNAGHLMILPFEHKATLEDLSSSVRAEMMEVVNIAIKTLKKVLKPNGLNVGINLGSAAGGGLPTHLHIHILPRWDGDTNFLAALGNTKVISIKFEDIFKKLKKELG